MQNLLISNIFTLLLPLAPNFTTHRQSDSNAPSR